MLNSPINFDANATTGVDPAVWQGVIERLAGGNTILNPSSVHSGGQRARALIEEAREEVFKLIGSPIGARVVFTSGATEANNSVILSPFLSAGEERQARHLLTTAIEHHSVLEAARRFGTLGGATTFIHPTTDGQFTADSFLNALHPESCLLSVMWANNETGQVLPIKEITRTIRDVRPELWIHTDGVQALGKMEVQFSTLGVDSMSLSAHKIGGFPGVGALVIRNSQELNPLLVGGPQETRFRAGTENLHGIVSFGYAAALVRKTLLSRIDAMYREREAVKQMLCSEISGAVVHAEGVPHLPNTLNLYIPGVAADDLVVAADLEGVCISSGAACASGKQDPSHVLLAMGLSEEVARQSIRISLLPAYRSGEIEAGCAAILRCVKRMRSVHS